MNQIDRRTFIKASAATAAIALNPMKNPANAAKTPIILKKALQYSMLPKDLSDPEKFALAAKCGFEGIEFNANTLKNPDSAKRLGELGRKTGLPIHALVFGG